MIFFVKLHKKQNNLLMNDFLPTTKEELNNSGIKQLDIIIVSGDVYIDSYYDGAAVIGRVLQDAGYTVGIISQPDISNEKDITRLGEPNLFWGVTAGLVDSMVANYTSLKKKKRYDDLTPESLRHRRPDRATIIYTNLIKKYFKSNKPIILGGVEASLRRIAHYDYWQDKIRRSVLFDAKADAIIYGMAEKTVVQLADKIKNNKDFRDLRGICHIAKDKKDNFIELPSYEEVASDKLKFIEMFHHFYRNNDPLNARGLCQRHGDRWLIQNPPQFNPTGEELDSWHSYPYKREVHPYYSKYGKVKALETIRFSVNTHRGCYGECNFCAITMHQGRTISSRSEKSILKELKSLTKHPKFKGIITDLGGPTANMFENSCKVQLTKGSCKDKRCSFPEICPAMNIDHSKQVSLLKKARNINGIKKVFIGSGVRYDLVLADEKAGKEYFVELVEHHVSGQMKIAPEHTEENVLAYMGKPGKRDLLQFKKDFYRYTKHSGKKQFLTYYFIAAHPGCNFDDMKNLQGFIRNELKLNPEQVQIFNPTPSTYSTLMYYTELDPWSLKPIFVEKNLKAKAKQKNLITPKEKRK
jgi:uncharacterized radical SAM protein YgiQ